MDSFLSADRESRFQVSSQAVERAGNVNLAGLSAARHLRNVCVLGNVAWDLGRLHCWALAIELSLVITFAVFGFYLSDYQPLV